MLYFAVFFLVIGAMYIIGGFTGTDPSSILSLYWPVFLIVLGIMQLLKKKTNKAFWGVFTVMSIFLLTVTMGLFKGDVKAILIGFVFLGIAFLFFSSLFGQKKSKVVFEGGYSEGHHFESHSFHTLSKDFLQERFRFTTVKYRIESNNFSGGDVDVAFSDVYFDLNDVIPLEEVMELDVKVNFGTLVLDVPSTWRVSVNGQELPYNNPVSNPNLLKINSKVNFGDLKVK